MTRGTGRHHRPLPELAAARTLVGRFGDMLTHRRGSKRFRGLMPTRAQVRNPSRPRI
jgi:hypothetical protein